MTEDEKIQRLLAEQRHNELMLQLKGIEILLVSILEELKPKEIKKEGE